VRSVKNPFRIGPGYLEHWVHEAREHWVPLEEAEDRALIEFEEAMVRLMNHRDALQAARRSFIPASSLSENPHPSNRTQQALYAATSDFFQSYYVAMSAFASFLKSFKQPTSIPAVPHRSNSDFINWLKPMMMFPEMALPELIAARDYRAMLDHKADRDPSSWLTYTDESGLTRIVLHGTGKLRPGARPKDELPLVLPEDDNWVFVAPDEDRVLWALAVQMNSLFLRLQRSHLDMDRASACQWELLLGEGDPRDGYPTFVAEAGTVVSAPKPRPSPGHTSNPGKDKKRNHQNLKDIVASYFSSDGEFRPPTP
jgi:hypothetical protein